MPNRWLFKTEPTDYSFAQLQKDGRTQWTGVKNPLALIHLRKVRRGDEILIYHTGKEKSIVGIARAAADAQGDAVEIVPLRSLPRPISLATIRAHPKFKAFELVRISRLAVMPVSDAHGKELSRLAGE